MANVETKESHWQFSDRIARNYADMHAHPVWNAERYKQLYEIVLWNQGYRPYPPQPCAM